MSARKVTLKDSIVSRVKATPPSHKCWFDRVAPEHQAELLEIKRAWLSGELKIAAIRLSEHISAVLRESGVSTVGYQGVILWLKRRD